jgi:hypothetical protein
VQPRWAVARSAVRRASAGRRRRKGASVAYDPASSLASLGDCQDHAPGLPKNDGVLVPLRRRAWRPYDCRPCRARDKRHRSRDNLRRCATRTWLLGTGAVTTPEQPPTLTIAEAAQVCDVSTSTIRRYLRAGRFPGARPAAPRGILQMVPGRDDPGAN